MAGAWDVFILFYTAADGIIATKHCEWIGPKNGLYPLQPADLLKNSVDKSGCFF
jgi:hypothetical protein